MKKNKYITPHSYDVGEKVALTGTVTEIRKNDKGIRYTVQVPDSICQWVTVSINEKYLLKEEKIGGVR